MSGIILESLLTCPVLRLYEAGSHAYGCLPALLRMQQLQGTVATESGGLLRVLFVRNYEVSSGSTRPWLLRGQTSAWRKAYSGRYRPFPRLNVL